MNITSIFITGLFAGGLTCLAVQGGLLASSIAQQEGDKLEEKTNKYAHMLPIISFILTRLIAYTLLGLLLGALGSVAQLSLGMKVILQFAVSVFMIGTALNLLQVHPIFRYFAIQPPKFLTRLVRNQSKSKSIFGPALLGAMTVFIPCGVTQAMMAYAIATGSSVSGAITMFTFILGTSPLFFLLGYVAKKLGIIFRSGFNKVVAPILLLIAFYSINGAVALTGSQFTLENLLNSVNCTISFCNVPKVAGATTGIPTVSQATVYILQSGYNSDPQTINVNAGSKVKLKLVNQGGGGCTQAFAIPKLNIQRTIPLGSSDEIDFTAPSTPGPLAFMCGMGMFRGNINVI